MQQAQFELRKDVLLQARVFFNCRPGLKTSRLKFSPFRLGAMTTKSTLFRSFWAGPMKSAV